MAAPSPPSRDRIVVGVSGGVDSAVAALLLKRAGHDVHALFMSNWDEDDAYCTAAADFQDARRSCERLGIPLHRVSFAAEYRERVFAAFLAEQRAGRTPNPDVACNREIKFGACLAHARRLGAGAFATGHYARRGDGVDGPHLLKARDLAKDQSYFLHAIERPALAATRFPLGELTKPEVRALARGAGLEVHDKPDSTGICFIGERPFREFLAGWLQPQPGPIETPDGRVIGEHRGVAFYTLGQRGGLEIGGRAGFADAPWYVASKDASRNALVVVQGHDHPLLLSSALVTGPAHWLVDPPHGPFDAQVKVRYRQADQAARIEPLDGGGLRVRFERPQRAVTPGQSCVLYCGARCLGGAVIDAVRPLAAAHGAGEAA
ncbi:MAG: tRNA 2-thiouridine(34) synthase MnmA [Steroidobacteraceae bacterium]|jgi:tRNA-specific 2-thiouridylase|nr:tRNA 2-thiouridine(34) synthase MnmA [Steroidobacteraceae bacterium]